MKTIYITKKNKSVVIFMLVLLSTINNCFSADSDQSHLEEEIPENNQSKQPHKRPNKTGTSAIEQLVICAKDDNYSDSEKKFIVQLIGKIVVDGGLSTLYGKNKDKTEVIVPKKYFVFTTLTLVAFGIFGGCLIYEIVRQCINIMKKQKGEISSLLRKVNSLQEKVDNHNNNREPNPNSSSPFDAIYEIFKLFA